MSDYKEGERVMFTGNYHRTYGSVGTVVLTAQNSNVGKVFVWFDGDLAMDLIYVDELLPLTEMARAIYEE